MRSSSLRLCPLLGGSLDEDASTLRHRFGPALLDVIGFGSAIRGVLS